MLEKTIIAQSPGRINLIGEHTDYNDGFVLPAAVAQKATFKLVKNGSEKIVNIQSENQGNRYSFALDNFKPIGNGWENYVMGVVHELQKIGAKLAGFDGVFGGDVPIGGGMSSSAALECSLAYGLNELFNLGLGKWEIIKACQMAEHNFVGIRCGIMDQFASVMGQKDHAMLLDCRSLEFKYIPCDFESYQLILLNTNVSHSLASSEYNTRRRECEIGVKILKEKFPTIKNLRDVSIQMLNEISAQLPDEIFRRCKHVILENQRVIAGTESLIQKDFSRLGQLIYQSHFSLQNDYEVSCEELDFLVDLTIGKDYILGSRMMGGGFGGCTLVLLEDQKVDQFINFAAEKYKNKFRINLTPYKVSIENGASVTSL